MLGNLTFRGDALTAQSEYFQYDTLNRVVRIETTTTAGNPGGTPQTGVVTTGYDAKGNITNRSDVGAYTYGGANAACSGLAGALSVAGAHAASSIVGGKNAHTATTPTATCSPATAAPSPGPRSTWSGRCSVAPAWSRSTTARIVPLPPRRRHAGRRDDHAVRRRQGDGGDRAPERQRRDQDLHRRLRCRHDREQGVGDAILHKDHLGSVDTITNAAGQVIQRMSFDRGASAARSTG